jgi:hypothetical protein
MLTKHGELLELSWNYLDLPALRAVPRQSKDSYNSKFNLNHSPYLKGIAARGFPQFRARYEFVSDKELPPQCPDLLTLLDKSCALCYENVANVVSVALPRERSELYLTLNSHYSVLLFFLPIIAFGQAVGEASGNFVPYFEL